MKHSNKIYLTTILLTICLSSHITILSQVPDPPGEHGSGTNLPAGGGAPIGSGLTILLGLGAAYGGKKIYEIRRNNKRTI
ncbi:MAG: hypothetical protein QM503_10455 [Bacteroidota bacterium]